MTNVQRAVRYWLDNQRATAYQAATLLGVSMSDFWAEANKPEYR